jgi:hypothetical protein
MVKNVAVSIFTVIFLAACDWTGVSSSGASNDPVASTETTPVAESSTSTVVASTTPTTATETVAAATPEPVVAPEPAPTAAAASIAVAQAAPEKECAVGRFDFRTDSDGKKHFDFQFLSGGLVRYNLTHGPTGTWTQSGSKITFVGPFGPGRADLALVFTVSQEAADCTVLAFRGRSPGGSDVTARRI